MSNPDARVPFTDYVMRHHPKLVQEFSATHLPPDELGLWASFKLIVELDQDGCIAGAPDIAFVDDADLEVSSATAASRLGDVPRSPWHIKVTRLFGKSLLVCAIVIFVVKIVHYTTQRYLVVHWNAALTVLEWAGGLAILYVAGLLISRASIRMRDLREAMSSDASRAFSSPSHRRHGKSN